jgi:hypothetical protein
MRWKGAKMRILAAILTFILLASPLYAQNVGGRGGAKGRASQDAEQQKADQQKKKATDDAYKAGLKMIPMPRKSMIHGKMHGSDTMQHYLGVYCTVGPCRHMPCSSHGDLFGLYAEPA